jgi:hypothetical protein
MAPILVERSTQNRRWNGWSDAMSLRDLALGLQYSDCEVTQTILKMTREMVRVTKLSCDVGWMEASGESLMIRLINADKDWQWILHRKHGKWSCFDARVKDSLECQCYCSHSYCTST